MHALLIFYALGGLTAVYLLKWIFEALYSPLRSIPGPFAARFSSLWYLKQASEAKFEKLNIDLHRKYGSIVRITPDHYSIDDPAAVKAIYGIGTKFSKSDWYYGWQYGFPLSTSIVS